MEYAIHLQFQTTNNEAEYEALLQDLELVKSLGVESVLVQGDSQLVMVQVNGTCEAREERMKKNDGSMYQRLYNSPISTGAKGGEYRS